MLPVRCTTGEPDIPTRPTEHAAYSNPSGSGSSHNRHVEWDVGASGESRRHGRLPAFITGIGASPLESSEDALRRTVLVASSLACTLAGTIWFFIYFLAGARVAASVPLGYAVVSLVSTVLFAATGHFRIYRTVQLSLILLLPWLMSLALGGFHPSSSVVIWSTLAPFGALLFTDLKSAIRWFLAFVVLVISGAVLDVPGREPPLPEAFVQTLYVLNFGMLFAILFAMMAYFTFQKNIFQERSEMLLHSILPKDIAELLKGSPQRIADHYEEASILFADVVDFTSLSDNMPPGDLVAMLDEVFLSFDVLVEEFGLEKIKTIGDCYMVAAGVPAPRGDHAHALARMALAMRRTVSKRGFGGQHIELRIGMNSGPVVAGVIGRKKFIYDLWGDAVNMASRMEAHGTGGSIQITRSTYELLKDNFVCRDAGVIAVKGKGDMEVYHLLGEKDAPDHRAATDSRPTGRATPTAGRYPE